MMPDDTEIDLRNKAIFACLMLTGGRDGALASLKLAHVDLVQGIVFFDSREVKTKNAKTFEAIFYPVDPIYRRTFENWVTYLREERLYRPSDALFPKPEIGIRQNCFTL